MNWEQLIALARMLASAPEYGERRGRPQQIHLRKAISAAYYAMFHTLAASNADTLVGAMLTDRQGWAWRQLYRAADHRPTRNKLTQASLGGRFSVAIRNFGEVFAYVQQARHSADYDFSSEFHAANVTVLINRVEIAITDFNQTPDDIRRDLAVHILTTTRSD